MIKSDCRYIIKRILIGVGICLTLSFINSCDVKALEFDDNYIITNGATNNYEGSVYYDEDTKNIVLYRKYLSTSLFRINTETYPYITCGTRYFDTSCYYSTDIFYMVDTDNSFNSNYYLGFYSPTKKLNQITFYNNDSRYPSPQSINQYMTNRNGKSFWENNFPSKFSTFDINTYNVNTNTVNNTVYYSKNFDTNPILTSTIDSLGVVKNKNQEENVITSYTFHPTFINFNTDNFITST